ncbi:Uncharacterised protein [uncultured archaeon]|nr:Uncharacterised protein [uncultured archaeon]
MKLLPRKVAQTGDTQIKLAQTLINLDKQQKKSLSDEAYMKLAIRKISPSSFKKDLKQFSNICKAEGIIKDKIETHVGDNNYSQDIKEDATNAKQRMANELVSKYHDTDIPNNLHASIKTLKQTIRECKEFDEKIAKEREDSQGFDATIDEMLGHPSYMTKATSFTAVFASITGFGIATGILPLTILGGLGLLISTGMLWAAIEEKNFPKRLEKNKHLLQIWKEVLKIQNLLPIEQIASRFLDEDAPKHKDLSYLSFEHRQRSSRPQNRVNP